MSKKDSFEKTSRDPFYRKLFSRVSHKSEVEDLRKDLSAYLEKPIHQFNLYPLYLWIPGTFLLIVNVLVTIFICLTYFEQKYFTVFINIIFYYISFFMLYVGKIERLNINRKKGLVRFSKMNIFLSKVEMMFKFDDIDYMEIVIKGIKRGADDHRKYFIRIYNKDKKIVPIQFGFTWSFDKIKYKYQICLAMIKGLVMLNVKDYLIKDESNYLDYTY